MLKSTCALPLFLVAGCGGTSMTMMPLPAALAVCSKMIPAGATASTTGSGGGLDAAGACAEATSAIAHAAAADLPLDGLTALGPAVAFTLPAPVAYPHGVDFVIPCDLGKAAAGATSSGIVVVAKRASGTVAAVPASNVLYEAPYHRLHFHALELATFQCAIPSSAGTMAMRHYTFRALGGVSMGGMGSSLNFWASPERYDGVAVMGADPGPDLTYSVGLFHDWFFSGFCSAEDQAAGRGKIGEVNADGSAKCPSPRKPMLDQNERAMDFEHLPYQKGEGVGLTSNRGFWMRGFRDISRAFGNAGYPSLPGDKTPNAAYLPPGVPSSTLALANADACAKPIVLKSYYDYKYNPDGSLPVITFCDGADKPNENGVFDPNPANPGTTPAQILLAVDVNGNGKRDAGEPVLLQGSEHFLDDGADGIPDEKEPGYDPVTNPDPNHDDYHWFWNPAGTEKNWLYDVGEKFDDFGVDGVKGTCQLGEKPASGIGGCYDFGEGNGKFDYAPNTANWYAHDPHHFIAAMSDESLARIDTYYDAGIRDFLDDAVSTNSLMGVLQSRGQRVGVWEGFPIMTGFAQSDEERFDINQVDFGLLGRHVYVHYGDPDVNAALVEETGDGRHVGTALQAVHRAQMMFYALSHFWPGGDTDTNVSGGELRDSETFTAKNGRVTPYAIVLPPGYNDPQNATKTYPIVYLMHGLGMEPKGLADFAVIAQSAMVNDKVPADRRVQKMIIAIADGACRPGGDLRNGPLPQTGDLCEEGAYYSDHPEGPYVGQQLLFDLQAEIEAKYRTKPPADLAVTN